MADKFIHKNLADTRKEIQANIGSLDRDRCLGDYGLVVGQMIGHDLANCKYSVLFQADS